MYFVFLRFYKNEINITIIKKNKKTNEPIPRKLTDRRKDGRTDPIL